MTEAEFDIFPPGLRGLNRLAMRVTYRRLGVLPRCRQSSRIFEVLVARF